MFEPIPKNQNPGDFPRGQARRGNVELLGPQTTTNEACDADEPGSEQAQCARFRNYRRLIADNDKVNRNDSTFTLPAACEFSAAAKRKNVAEIGANAQITNSNFGHLRSVGSAGQSVIGCFGIGDHGYMIVGYVHEIAAGEFRSARLRESEKFVIGSKQSRAYIFQIAIDAPVISRGLWSFRHDKSVRAGVESTASECSGRSQRCHGECGHDKQCQNR